VVVVSAAPRFPVATMTGHAPALALRGRPACPVETRETKGDPGDNVLAYAHTSTRTERSTPLAPFRRRDGWAGAGVTQGDVYTLVPDSAGVATGQEFDVQIVKP
jgi:hypothetical protein